MGDSKNIENWMIRSYENGKVWYSVADMLDQSQLYRQVFVAATYAAEEFAKSFLLWWYLVTGKDTRNMLSRHDNKQALASVLAHGPYLDEFSECIAGLFADPIGYVNNLRDDELSWENERRLAIYEDKQEADPDEFNSSFVLGISATLEERMRRLINDFYEADSPDDVNKTFIYAFEQPDDFFDKVGAVIESWQDIT